MGFKLRIHFHRVDNIVLVYEYKTLESKIRAHNIHRKIRVAVDQRLMLSVSIYTVVVTTILNVTLSFIKYLFENMGADWWKSRKNRVCITLYKHENFSACRMDFTEIQKSRIVQNSGFRIKNINRRGLYSRRKWGKVFSTTTIYNQRQMPLA